VASLVNLYVVAPEGAALDGAARALVEGGALAFPGAACTPLREKPAVAGLRTPQGVALLDPARRREVGTAAALAAELTSGAPVLVAFPGLVALSGAAPQPDCAVGFYAFPGGHPLRLVEEAGGAPRHDGIARAWLHLQGEGAPGAEAFRATAAGRAVLAAWPGAAVVQIDWA
jgi:hypothetical protein